MKIDFDPHIYFCSECKKKLKVLDELLFVEPASNIGFCSNTCIENYYRPLVDHYSELEGKWRKENNAENEKVLELIDQTYFTNELFFRPDRIFCYKNDFDQRFFSFIREMDDEKYGKFYLVALCFTIDHRPSFVISLTATCHEALAMNFHIGEEIEDISKFYKSSESKDVVEISEDVLMEVENKKSVYLASLLEERSPADIPFESFHLYEEFVESTMLEPDQIFKSKDVEGDVIITYVKAQDLNGVSFYHFIVCMQVEQNWNDNTDALIPIIMFPTVDGELSRKYRKGDLISGNLKN